MRRPTKAYRNLKFLNGDHARSIRILCEYLEPATRLHEQGIHKAVIFFGSARITTRPRRGMADYYAQAADLAERLAEWTCREQKRDQRYYLCTGGGDGIMRAIHEGGARVDRSLNIGLNISLPFEQNLNPHVELGHAFEFHYFFMRKFWFMNLARAAVIFPGGFGTLDELFELLTLIQTGKSARMPIVLYGRKYWLETVNFSSLARRGLINREDLKLFKVCDSPKEAFEYLRRGLREIPRPVR